MLNHAEVKLGRKAIKRDTRTLRLARYFTPSLAPAPPTCDWTKGVKEFGMMLNDTYGCCTIAAIGHAIQTWSLNSGTEITVQDAEILKYYEQWCGYNPSDPSTDAGGIELDVLTDWRKQSFASYTLGAFGSINPSNIEYVKQAINLFGGLYIGVSLPLSAQGQSVWDAVSGSDGEPGSWGGHAIYIVGYDEATFTCITWGALQKMTTAFWEEYVDESYGLVSPNWIAANGSAPSGFNLAELEADLAQIN